MVWTLEVRCLRLESQRRGPSKPSENLKTVAPLIRATTNNPVPGSPVVVIGPKSVATYPVDLTIKSKTLSLTDFSVTDVNGTVIFSIKGKIFSLHDRRVLLDASGNPLVTLQQNIINAHRRWQVFRGDRDSTDDKDLLFSTRRSFFIIYA